MRRLAEPLRRLLAEVPRRELYLLAGAMVTGFALVVVYVLATRPHTLVGDEPLYHEYGRFFADGKLWWNTTPFGEAHASAWKAPGYPAWVGFWYALLGTFPVRVEMVQALLAPVTVALTWTLARRLYTPRVAIASAWVVALFPLAWEYYGLLFPEALAVPLTIAVLVLVLGREPTTARVLAVGALLGLNLLVRPTAFFLVGGITAAWIVASGWRRGLALTAASVAIAALLVVPWTIRNYIVADGFIPISVQDGAAFGTFNEESASDPENPFAWRAFPRGIDEVIDRTQPISDAEFRSRLQDAAVDYIADHPQSVPKALFWNGITRFWDLRPPADAIAEADFQGRSRAVRGIGLAIYYLLLPLALLGIWQARRRPQVLAPVLALAIVASIAFTVIGGTRYRAPLEPLVAILACSPLAGRLAFDPGRERPLAKGATREAAG